MFYFFFGHSIYVTMQSIRFNLDQETLFFLINFFTALDDAQAGSSNQTPQQGYGRQAAAVGYQAPPANLGESWAAEPERAKTVRFDTGEETLEILPEQEQQKDDYLPDPCSSVTLEQAEEVFEDAVASVETSTGKILE